MYLAKISYRFLNSGISQTKRIIWHSGPNISLYSANDALIKILFPILAEFRYKLYKKICTQILAQFFGFINKKKFLKDNGFSLIFEGFL